MKKTILVALLFLASCAKENSATDVATDQVAATFAAASITRVADNQWEANDKIGITMTVTASTALADGNYFNVPHTVGAAGVTGTFSPDSEVIYFPVDGSVVDFYAYYPYASLDADNNLAVSVASQIFSDIDVVATKAEGYTKASPNVTFSGDEAFAHQLSKLTITIVAGLGIESLSGLETTINGQCTTAKYNLYTSELSDKDAIAEMTAVTTEGATTTAEAILIPTDAIEGSTIVFTIGADDYIWKTDALTLEQGSEHKYTITITKTGIIASGATISDWNDGEDGTGTAE